MRRSEKPAEWRPLLMALLFPPGWSAFMSAIFFMMLAYGVFLGNVITSLELAQSRLNPLHVHAMGLVSAMAFIHPTFLVTRGNYKAQRFLKIFSVVFIGCCATLMINLLLIEDTLSWGAVVGLLLSLIPAWAYRTSSFRRFVDHFAEIKAIADILPRRWL